MAFKANLFDPKKTEGVGNVDLPDGKYTFQITNAKLASTQKGKPKVQLNISPVEGPITGTKSFDSWNVPGPTDPDDYFPRRFWKDVWTAWPFIYEPNASDPKAPGTVHEELLEGLRYKATVIHEDDDKGIKRMRIRYHEFIPRKPTATADAPPPAGEAKPGTYQQP